MTEYLPEDNKAYKRKDYWDARFSRYTLAALSGYTVLYDAVADAALLRSEDSYDWLARYDNVAALLDAHVARASRVLMVRSLFVSTIRLLLLCVYRDSDGEACRTGRLRQLDVQRRHVHRGLPQHHQH